MAHRLQKLQPQHHAAIRMRLEGLAAAAIAERLGVQRRTVYLWFGDPLVKTELDRQLTAVGATFRERLAEAALAAVGVLQELATAELVDPVDPATKLKAAQTLVSNAETPDPGEDADRAPLRADVYINPPEGSLAATILASTPDQLRMIDDRLAQAVASGNLTPSVLRPAPAIAAEVESRSSRSPG